MHMSDKHIKHYRQLLRSGAEARLARAKVTEPRIAQALQVHHIELEMQNEELHRAQAALEASRDRYLQLYDFAPVGYITLSGDGLIADANVTCAALLGVDRQKLINCRFAHYVAPEDSERWHQLYFFAKQPGGRQRCELDLRQADGATLHAQLDCRHMETACAPPLMCITITDITVQKQAENILCDARYRLENQVADAHRDMEKLRQETAEISTALNVLLKYRETDKSEARNLLSSEIESSIMPFLKRLKKAAGNQKQTGLIDIIETNLHHLVKCYGRAVTLPAVYQQLTPVEIQVASLIRQKLPTKHIAATLNISPGTVSIHRKHIRKKLKLNGKPRNLHSYLLSLEENVPP
jgi:PAS domain S-box-containing protein